MWPLDATYAWLDTAFRVRCEDAALGERLDRLFHPTEIGSAQSGPSATYVIRSVGGGLELYRGQHRIVSGDKPQPIVERLVTELNRAALTGFAGFATHAGVVAHGNVAVVLPAPSGGGKSTLVAACILQGFDYVSDEALCLGFDDATVVPYPRPLGLSPWSQTKLGLAHEEGMTKADEAFVTAGELGGMVAGSRLRVGDVVLIERREGPPKLTPARRSEVLAKLIRMSFNHYRRPKLSFELVADVVHDCRAWKLACGDPLAAAGLLRQELKV